MRNILIFFLLLILSLDSACAQNTADATAMAQGGAQFIPEGYTILKAVKGDLNLDAFPDWLLILAKNGEEKLWNPAPARPTLIILGQASGTYMLAGRNDSVVYTHDMGGMSSDEPLDEVTINQGSFSVQHAGGMNRFRWVRLATFSYELMENNWFLQEEVRNETYLQTTDSGDVEVTKDTSSSLTRVDFGRISFSKFNIYRELPRIAPVEKRAESSGIKKRIPDISYIKHGTRFGFCEGYCYSESIISQDKVIRTQSWGYIEPREPGWDSIKHPNKVDTTSMTKDRWRKIVNAVDSVKFFNLPEKIGNPDGLDEGAEWIEIMFHNKVHRVTFSYGTSVEGMTNLLEELRKKE